MFGSLLSSVRAVRRPSGARSQSASRARRGAPRLSVEQLESRHLLSGPPCLPTPAALYPGVVSGPPGEVIEFLQTPPFVFAAVPGAHHYILVVQLVPPYSDVVYQADVSPSGGDYEFHYDPYGFLPPNEPLTWKVKAIGADGCSGYYSEMMYFTINVPGVTCPLPPPVTYGPGTHDPNNPEILTQNPPTFRWSFLLGATSSTIHVQDAEGPPFLRSYHGRDGDGILRPGAIRQYYDDPIEFTPPSPLPPEALNRTLRWKIKGTYQSHSAPGRQCQGHYAADRYFKIVAAGPGSGQGSGSAPVQSPTSAIDAALSSIVSAVTAGASAQRVSDAVRLGEGETPTGVTVRALSQSLTPRWSGSDSLNGLVGAPSPDRPVQSLAARPLPWEPRLSTRVWEDLDQWFAA